MYAAWRRVALHDRYEDISSFVGLKIFHIGTNGITSRVSEKRDAWSNATDKIPASDAEDNFGLAKVTNDYVGHLLLRMGFGGLRIECSTCGLDGNRFRSWVSLAN